MTRTEALTLKLRGAQTRLATAKLALHQRLKLQREIDTLTDELRSLRQHEQIERGEQLATERATRLDASRTSPLHSMGEDHT